MGGSWWQSLNKPYRYPGDFEMLELLYDSKPNPRSTSPLARLLDIWGQTTTLPRAVVARKNCIRQILEELAGGNGEKKSVLSVACGGARELRELTPSTFESLRFHLVDADERALAFIKSFLSSRAFATDCHVTRGDATEGDVYASIEPCDMVYSFGLFDYLPDRLLRKTARNAMTCLKLGGSFVFCLKDIRFYDPFFYELFYDWRFVHRTRDDGPRIASVLGLTVTSQSVVEGGAVTVFQCTK